MIANTTFAQCDIRDWEALKKLYETSNGSSWKNKTGWEEVLNDAPSSECNLESLYGISLDNTGRVSKIELEDNNAFGEIPFEVILLPNVLCVDLSLYANLKHSKNIVFPVKEGLQGDIPKEIVCGINLPPLRLRTNILSGSIPIELLNAKASDFQLYPYPKIFPKPKKLYFKQSTEPESNQTSFFKKLKSKIYGWF